MKVIVCYLNYIQPKYAKKKQLQNFTTTFPFAKLSNALQASAARTVWLARWVPQQEIVLPMSKVMPMWTASVSKVHVTTFRFCLILDCTRGENMYW
jgi:hypothetical protein